MSEATIVKDTDTPIVREVGEKVRMTLGLDMATVKDLGDGVFEATVTTSLVDRQGESIDTTGIDTSTYMGNPVVLYGHDYQGLPIGKTLKLTSFTNKMKARFQLAIAEYPFAATVASMIKGGYLNAVSIGGMVRQWSDDYKTIEKLEMVEFSIVPVPANPDALITSRSLEEITGKSVTAVQAEYKSFVHKTMVDNVSTLGDDEINNAIKTLEGLLAALKESAKPTPSAGNTNTEVKRIKRITLRDNAKAVATQSQRVIKLVKLRTE